MADSNNEILPEKLNRVLVTDCGSTTTKAILFEKTESGWHTSTRGEAPTTVENPVADVTIGAKNSFREVEELSKRKILHADQSEGCPLINTSVNKDEGVDLYLSTSSAGGGLQMVVAGVISSMTTKSAQRAALGAGAIVMDAMSIDDNRDQHQRAETIRHLRPDIILLSGGTDGGTTSHPLELAETILQADPRPRFGKTLRLPVIFAGNKDAKDEAEEILQSHFEFVPVENLRPTLEEENITPARDAIHELFLHHVMSHAPGYKKLMNWSPVPIMPTPAAVGNMVLSAAKMLNMEILAVDIGGATTDVFSAFRQNEDDNTEFVFNRTVSANLGMSYSVANVCLEAGIENINRWLPFEISNEDLQDTLRNKMIRPTTIPQTHKELLIEQSVCREALRIAFIQHKKLATGIEGARKQKKTLNLFKQQEEEESLVNMNSLDLIIGSGGVLSHAPDRKSAAFMLIDAYEPLGVTRLAVDSIFMMPHLGIFASIHADAATEIFIKDCLVNLGTCIAASGKIDEKLPALRIDFNNQSSTIESGTLHRIEYESDKPAPVTITPLQKTIDVGNGKGKQFTTEITGGEAGIIVDTRGRALGFKQNSEERISDAINFYKALSLEVNV